MKYWVGTDAVASVYSSRVSAEMALCRVLVLPWRDHGAERAVESSQKVTRKLESSGVNPRGSGRSVLPGTVSSRTAERWSPQRHAGVAVSRTRAGSGASSPSCLTGCVWSLHPTQRVAGPACLFTTFSKGISTVSTRQSGQIRSLLVPRAASSPGAWRGVWAAPFMSYWYLQCTWNKNDLSPWCLSNGGSLSHCTSLQKLSLEEKPLWRLGPLLNCSWWLQSMKQFWLKNQSSG